MKEGIRQVLGKTISGIVVAENDKEPAMQLFLTFTDGTYFEIWGNSFNCCSELDRGGVAEAKRYAESQGAIVGKISVITQGKQSKKKSKKPKDMMGMLVEQAYEDLMRPIFRKMMLRKGLLPKDPSKK